MQRRIKNAKEKRLKGKKAINKSRRKEKEDKRNRIAMWDFVVKGGRERGKEKKREKRRVAMPVRTECGVYLG